MERASERTSITTNCNLRGVFSLPFLRSRNSNSTGFSLVEIMIVIVIIGLFVSYGARRFSDRSNTVKTQVRRFSTMTKKLRNRARLDNKTYRLVFDLPIERNKQQSYWIESTDKAALLLNEEQREELEEVLEEKETESGEKFLPDPQGFAQDSSILKEAPATLPEGLFFESIELMGDPVEKITDGRVYIYFFPQGYVQGSAIHFTDRDTVNWTIIIEGLTGRVNIFPKERSLKDFNFEKE